MGHGGWGQVVVKGRVGYGVWMGDRWVVKGRVGIWLKID